MFKKKRIKHIQNMESIKLKNEDQLSPTWIHYYHQISQSVAKMTIWKEHPN